MLRVLIVVAIFAFVRLGFYYHNGGRIFPDPAARTGSPRASPSNATAVSAAPAARGSATKEDAWRLMAAASLRDD
jgi:hypothetical protein